MLARTCASSLGRCRNQTRRLGRAVGFTLIEVLVVVTIIALLLAILLPSLTKARAQAKALVCKSDMRQLILGMHTYVGSDRRLPGTCVVWGASFGAAPAPKKVNPHPGSVNDPWGWFRPEDSWLGLCCAPKMFDVDEQQKLWDFVGVSNDPSEPGCDVPKKGSLWKYAHNEKVYLCPEDKKGMPISTAKGGGGNNRFSYTMNGILGFMAPENAQSFTYVTRFRMQSGASPAPAQWIEAGTRVAWNPSEMLLLMEEGPWNNTNHGMVNDSIAADSYLALRHDPRKTDALANFGYLDGHVAAKRYPYMGTITDPAGNPQAVFQGVDLMNEFRFPYDYCSNEGGAANVNAFITHFPYPYH